MNGSWSPDEPMNDRGLDSAGEISSARRKPARRPSKVGDGPASTTRALVFFLPAIGLLSVALWVARSLILPKTQSGWFLVGLATLAGAALVIRLVTGRTPAILGIPFVVLLAAILGSLATGGSFPLSSEKGRHILNVLNETPFGEKMVVTNEQLAEANIYANDLRTLQEIHEKVRQIFERHTERIRKIKGGRSYLVDSLVLMDPLARANVMNRLEKLRKSTLKTKAELTDYLETIQRRYCVMRDGCWKPLTYPGAVFVDHVNRASYIPENYENVIRNTIWFLSEEIVSSGGAYIVEGELLFDTTRSRQASEARRYARAALQWQHGYAKEVNCPVDAIRIFPELRIP